MHWNIVSIQNALWFFFLSVILSQHTIQCANSSLDVKNPDTWKELADERFKQFEQSFLWSVVKPPKNVILFIGDGMSLNTVTGARYLKAEKMNLLGGDVQLVWDDWPVASLVRTFNSDRLTTDSGAAATAFMSGVKGPFNTVGITGTVKCCECTELKEVERAKSSIYYASRAGLSTGIVTTTRVTHATPAAAYANILHRDWESNGSTSKLGYHCVDAAVQLLTNASDVNVVMGGGATGFYGGSKKIAFSASGKRSDSRDLLSEWRNIQAGKQRKYAILHTNEDFKKTNWSSVDYVLGLFAPEHMDYYIDNSDQPSLADMTEAAIKVLSRNPKGFLLLVEGGRIDHGHHKSQAKHALTETLEFEKAIDRASTLVKGTDTLLMVTADHSHAYGVIGYPSRNLSVFDVGDDLKAADNKSYLISSYFNGPRGLVNEFRSDPATEDRFANNYTAQSFFRLNYATHGAEDVPIYAKGPFSQLFHSASDNTFIAYATMYSLCIGPYVNKTHCSGGYNASNSRLPQMKYYLVLLSFILYNFLN